MVFCFVFLLFEAGKLGPIGQKELVKTAITVEIQMVVAVLSFWEQDTPWTKRVGRIAHKR